MLSTQVKIQIDTDYAITITAPNLEGGDYTLEFFSEFGQEMSIEISREQLETFIVAFKRISLLSDFQNLSV